MRMKLCFLGDIRSVHVQKFIKYFAEDHDTCLISLDYIGDERVGPGMEFFKSLGTEVHIIKKVHLPLSPFIVRWIIRKIDPDLVQAHFITNYGFLGAFSGVHPLIIYAQGDDILIHPWQSWLYPRLVRYALRCADYVLCDGANSIDNLVKLGIQKEKTAIIYPGIDMQLFHPSKREARVRKTVFYPRGFDKIYDVDTLFEAMKIIYWNVPKVEFILLGIGTELKRFEDRVRESKMSESVRYLGNIPNKDVPQYLASSDVSITTSLSDGGIPVSTIEAMACGVPVVSTDAGDAGMWIQDGISGYIVEKKNPVALSERVIELLNDDSKRASFGKAARQAVETRYNYQTEMRKIEEMYLDQVWVHFHDSLEGWARHIVRGLGFVK